jgi:hypothetical protein
MRNIKNVMYHLKMSVILNVAVGDVARIHCDLCHRIVAYGT